MTVSPGCSRMFCVNRLPLHDVLVIERNRRLFSALGAENDDVLRLGVLAQAASQRDQLQYARGHHQGIPPGLFTSPVMNTCRLLISRTTIDTVGSDT